MKHLLYTLLLGVFLTSCYRKIDLDEYRTTPKMVINSVVSPDTVVMASITRTWFYPDKKPYVNLPHAHVELYINNQYITLWLHRYFHGDTTDVESLSNDELRNKVQELKNVELSENKDWNDDLKVSCGIYTSTDGGQ